MDGMVNKMIKTLANYTNGNYNVILMEDGSKFRMNNEDHFEPAFAESYDIKITSVCTGSNCEYCYEGCGPEGKHADLNQSFFNTIHPGTEIAINGNDLSHPGLPDFLRRMRNRKVIVNMTVNQIHFEKYFDTLKEWASNKMIWGLGISLVNPTTSFIEKAKQFPNAIIHVINGIVSVPQLEMLADNGFKLLILGYKKLCRGEDYYDIYSYLVEAMQEDLKQYLFTEIIPQNWFSIISFDNLALEQLNVREHVDKEAWEKNYLGEDGFASFYIDAVDGTFAKNSVAPANERYPIMNNVDDMFNFIRSKTND